jgi:primary-amine oxidase
MNFLKRLLLAASSISIATAAPHRDWDVHAGKYGSLNRRNNSHVGIETCPVPTLVETTAKVPSPFKHLSDQEISAITSWLQDPKQGLNLTDVSNPNKTIADNYIWHMEELKPNKTDVLAYLDDGKPFPRYARVVVNEGGKKKPVVTEYSVGFPKNQQ